MGRPPLHVMYDGARWRLPELARALGIPYSTMYQRLKNGKGRVLLCETPREKPRRRYPTGHGL